MAVERLRAIGGCSIKATELDVVFAVDKDVFAADVALPHASLEHVGGALQELSVPTKPMSQARQLSAFLKTNPSLA